MNAGFEDVEALDELIDNGESWPEVFEAFFEKRKTNADAIAGWRWKTSWKCRRNRGPSFYIKRSWRKFCMTRFRRITSQDMRW